MDKWILCFWMYKNEAQMIPLDPSNTQSSILSTQKIQKNLFHFEHTSEYDRFYNLTLEL